MHEQKGIRLVRVDGRAAGGSLPGGRVGPNVWSVVTLGPSDPKVYDNVRPPEGVIITATTVVGGFAGSTA